MTPTKAGRAASGRIWGSWSDAGPLGTAQGAGPPPSAFLRQGATAARPRRLLVRYERAGRRPAQSRPIFYSLPRRRCYARDGVDRPASRHAGLRSLLPRPPQRSMEARPCSSKWSTFLSRLCDAPQRRCPDDPKRLTRSRRRSAVGETRKLAAILVSDVVGYSRLTGSIPALRRPASITRSVISARSTRRRWTITSKSASPTEFDVASPCRRSGR